MVLQGVSFCRGLADHHHPNSSCHRSQLHHFQVRLSQALSLYHLLTLFLRKTEDLKKTKAEGTLEDASRDQIWSRPGVDDREDEREIERNPCSVGCLMSVKGDGESCVSGRVERLPRGEPAQQVLSSGPS